MRFGPTFADEIAAAGLSGLPFSWGEPSTHNKDDDGIFGRERLTVEQNAILDRVIAAHDPAARNAASSTSTPSLYAVAMLGVSDGQISGIELASRFSAALWMDVGLYHIFFAETQPDTAYIAKAYRDGDEVIRVVEKAADYIVVTAFAGLGGAAIDPPDLTIEIIRIV